MIFKALARVFFLLKGTFFSFVRKKIATFFLLLLISTAMECIGPQLLSPHAASGEKIIVRTDGTCSLANVDYERSTQPQDTRTKANGTNAYQKRLSIERIVIDRHFSVGYVIKDVVSGPGGDRTLVQTGKSYAFYTLISAIVFEQR